MAKTQLENAYKPAARAKLKDAVQSRDIEAILLAIEQGKAAGLSVMAIAEAAEIVKEEELKIQLRRRMGELYGCTNVAELRAAIKLGQLHGLNQELDDARKQLGELEEQGAMCARVSKAIESGEILQIKEAVAAAEELSRRVLTPCIPTELLQEADAAMQREIISAAQSMIQEAIKKCSGAAAIHRDGNPPEQESFNAKAVLQARRRSQANFEAALEAMGGESRPGSPPEPNPRQSGLGKRRTSALTQLGAAGAGEEYIQRIQMLKTAINGAEVLGLGESEIQPAREAMLEQTKKLQACQALAQGKKLKSLHHIQQALEMAHEAGLSHMEMKAALDAQKEIKKMDEAAGKLEKAVDLRDLEKLRWAIKWAKEAKVDEDDVADAQEVLQELEMRQKALNQLKCAQEAEDMEALAKALDEADCLDEEELEPYEQALRAGRHSRAQKALDEAMESRSIPALEEALSLAETAEFSGDLTGCHRVLAEEMIVQAMTSTVLALHRLRKAIEEATLWAPDFEPLAGALKRLKMEEQRERARESLQGALKSLDPSKLAQAIRAGRDCLEDWEMRGAEKALDRIRQEIMDDMYKSAIGPRSS